MTKTRKRLLFYTSFILFIIGTWVTILYAQGFKYDFSRGVFIKTGALNLEVNASADVYIDDKYAGATSFFGNSFRKDGLLPGSYSIKIQKNNYSVWTKRIIITEQYVTDYSHIGIYPTTGEEYQLLRSEVNDVEEGYITTNKALESALKLKKVYPVEDLTDYYFLSGDLYSIKTIDGQIKIIKIAVNVAGFALSPDKNKIAWWNKNELYIYWKNNTYYYNKLIGTSELLSRFSEPILTAGWFRDSDHILLKTGTSKIIEIDTRGGVNIISLQK